MNTIDPGPGRRMASLALCAALCGASMQAAAGTFEVLHHFDGTDGANPNVTMVLDSAGVLHGATKSRPRAGHEPSGTLFHIHTDGSGFETDHAFTRHEARYPAGDLSIDASDTIYGTLISAGENGAIFTEDPVNGYQVLTAIGHGMGSRPYGGVTPGPDGTLYGTTSEGGGHPCACGTVYKWDPVTRKFTVLHKFLRDDDGAAPYAPLLLRGDTLYGTTFWGGPFSVKIDGTGFEAYTPDEGYQFNSGLTPDAHGNLWGVVDGGAYDAGGIYRVTPAGVYQWRASFRRGQGEGPTGRLVLGQDGLMYGNAGSGGTQGMGTIFSYDPVANVITKLHDFDGAHGANPYDGLVQDANGTLYGATFGGGKYGYGVIFRIVP
jgi:uncharacterized repeat protein (TIGR03803 family)